MPVGILIITHGEIGEELLATAKSTLGGDLPLHCRALSSFSQLRPRLTT